MRVTALRFVPPRVYWRRLEKILSLRANRTKYYSSVRQPVAAYTLSASACVKPSMFLSKSLSVAVRSLSSDACHLWYIGSSKAFSKLVFYIFVALI